MKALVDGDGAATLMPTVTGASTPLLSNTSSFPRFTSSFSILIGLSLASLLSLYFSFTSNQPIYPPGSLAEDARGGGAGSCRMSYTSPSYLHLEEFGREYTRLGEGPWGLYLYREGGWDTDPFGQDGKLALTGTPVVFVPGNAGSFRQVRSLAGTASRIWWELPGVKRKGVGNSQEGARNLDFFTIDFNDDFSAFHGQTLLDQSEYLADCIRFILSLYQQKREGPDRLDPTSVIVVAHSMGGIVARAAFLHPHYQSHSISTLITIATPHILPPVSVDKGVEAVYDAITKYWRLGYNLPGGGDEDGTKAEEELRDTILISISGGLSDITIASETSSLVSLLPASGSNGFTVFTTSIPGVNTPVDHLAMLWCNQLMHAIVEGILSIVDVRNSSGVISRAGRLEKLSDKLQGGLETNPRKLDPTKFELEVLERGEKSTNLAVGERLIIRPENAPRQRTTYLLPIPPARTYGSSLVFTLLTSSAIGRGKDSAVEVYACDDLAPSSASECTPLFPSHNTALPLSKHSTVSPTLPAPVEDGTMGFLSVDVAELEGRNAILVVVRPAAHIPHWVLAEFGDKEKRVQVVQSGLIQLLLGGFKVEAFPSSPALISELWIPALDTSLVSLKLRAFRSPCQDSTSLFAPLMRQYSSSVSESKYYPNVRTASLYTHSSGPFLPSASSPFFSAGARLQFFLDPTCPKSLTEPNVSDLAVEIKVDLWGTLGNLAMRYRMAGLAFPFAIVMLTMAKQLVLYNNGHPFIPFGAALALFAKSYLFPLLGSLTLLSLIQSISVNSHLASVSISEPSHALHSAFPDTWISDALLGNRSSFFMLLMAFMVFSAMGMVFVEYMVLQGLVSSSAWVVQTLQARGPARLQAYLLLSETREALPIQRVISMSALLLLVLFFAPYQFAFLVIFVVHLFSTIRSLLLAQASTGPTTKSLWDRYHYNFVVLFVMFTLLPMNAMILVVWVRNLAVGWLAPFSSDHNVLNIAGFLLCVESIHSGKMLKRSEGGSFSFRSSMTWILPTLAAGYALLYGVRYAHNMYPLANLLLLWLAVNSGSGASSLIGSVVGSGVKRRNSLIRKVASATTSEGS